MKEPYIKIESEICNFIQKYARMICNPKYARICTNMQVWYMQYLHNKLIYTKICKQKYAYAKKLHAEICLKPVCINVLFLNMHQYEIYMHIHIFIICLNMYRHKYAIISKSKMHKNSFSNMQFQVCNKSIQPERNRWRELGDYRARLTRMSRLSPRR